MQPTEDTKPWYKQAWPWFLISLPASAVIAGIATVIIATKHSDSLVKSDYYKQGLALNQSVDRQKFAQTMNLRFELKTVNPQQWQLLSSHSLKSPVLYIDLQHPVDEEKDRTLVFNRNEMPFEFQANDDSLLNVNYRVRIYPPDQQWEILSRWNPIQQTSIVITAK